MAPILGIIHILSLLLYQQVPVLQATGTSTALDRTGIT